MTDRLSLTNGLADASIERKAAERIATEIFDAIQATVATKADLHEVRADLHELKAELLLRTSELEHRMTLRFGSVMVVLTGIIVAAIRYLPHG